MLGNRIKLPGVGSAYRSRNIGFVFQAANLISYKNVVENVALPLFYQNVKHERFTRL